MAVTEKVLIGFEICDLACYIAIFYHQVIQSLPRHIFEATRSLWNNKLPGGEELVEENQDVVLYLSIKLRTGS